MSAKTHLLSVLSFLSRASHSSTSREDVGMPSKSAMSPAPRMPCLPWGKKKNERLKDKNQEVSAVLLELKKRVLEEI
jgi:hypothetical protein